MSKGCSVAFEESFLYVAKGGVARYISSLLKALRPYQGPELRIEPLAFRVPNFEYHQPGRMLKTLAREFLWQRHLAPRLLQALQCDVFHMPAWYDFVVPGHIRSVATLHDLHYLVIPHRYRKWTRLRMQRELRMLATVDRIICVSQSTADDAIRLLKLPVSRLQVVPLGCSFNDASAEEAVPFPLQNEFFLFVSSLEPGKNLALLRKTWELASQSGISLPPLVIVGKRIEGVESEGTPPPSWIYAGRLNDQQLTYLYRRAIALLYPSKYEGFGIPILESMALGTPVVCSAISSLPEVGGAAAIYADQTPESYLASMLALMREGAFRAEKVAEGLAWAKTFTWDRTALQTLEVYRSLL